MDNYVRVSASFDAGHKAETRNRCRRQHGHRWTIEAEQRSSRSMAASEPEILLENLYKLIAEWRDRDLNEMLANFEETTPERLAPWVMERLLANHQLLTEVSVSDGTVIAVVRREPLR